MLSQHVTPMPAHRGTVQGHHHQQQQREGRVQLQQVEAAVTASWSLLTAGLEVALVQQLAWGAGVQVQTTLLVPT